jgi:hypothetical protein
MQSAEPNSDAGLDLLATRIRIRNYSNPLLDMLDTVQMTHDTIR